MNALRGLAWLLVFQASGEALARLLALPFPGPVIGSMLLIVGLRWEAVRGPVAQVADFLLSHLSLLFVPVGVGVIVHWQLVARHGIALLVVIVLSTWIGLAVTALALNAFMREENTDE